MQYKAQVNKLLTDVSNGLKSDNFIADQVFPEVFVKQDSGIIGGYTNDHLRDIDDNMGGEQPAKQADGVDYTITTTYKLEKHGLMGIVTEEQRANVEDPFEAESDKVMGLTNLILTARERSLAATLFSGATWGANTAALSGNSRWDNYNLDPANASSPQNQLLAAKNGVLTSSGAKINAGVMGQYVFNAIQHNPIIMKNLGFTYKREGMMSLEEIRTAMGLDFLFVSDVPYNAARKGQSDSLAQVWGKSMLFYVRPKQAAKFQVSTGYFLQRRDLGGMRVYKTPVANPPEADMVIVVNKYQNKLMNASSGYLFTTVVA